jgi:hypothetical protein
MSEQNFKSHSRWVPLWHFVTSSIIVAVLTGSIVNLYRSTKETLYSASLLVAISFILISFFVFTRNFALRAQDRAIRAEENLRHFILTGKPLDSQLRMGQIIALRFAGNDEMAALAAKAAAEKLNSREIKQLIRNWRPDYHRA